MIDTPPEPPAAHAYVIEQRLTACGLAAEGVALQYDANLEGFYIIVSAKAGATPEQFACIHEAAAEEFVVFDQPELAGQYHAYTRERLRPQVMAEAEKKLRERGLWDGFPARENYAAFGSYLEALEAHAGLEPGKWLRATNETSITLDLPVSGADIDTFEAIEQQSADLLMVLFYATARDRTEFGFIGNDKAPE